MTGDESVKSDFYKALVKIGKLVLSMLSVTFLMGLG